MRDDFAGVVNNAQYAAGVPEMDRQLHSLVLFSKPGCCLCDDVKPLLETLAAEYGLAVQVNNILDDRRWYDTYRYRIPVVSYRDMVLAEGRVDVAAVRTRLLTVLMPVSVLADASVR